RAKEAAKPPEYAEGVEPASPGLAACGGLPWVSVLLRANPEGVPQRRIASIPHVPLVVFDLIFLQQAPEFVLIRFAAIMFFLVLDVALERRKVRRADRERAVPVLPVKCRQRGELIFDPNGRTLFEFLDEGRDIHRLRQAAGNMDMIVDAADFQ